MPSLNKRARRLLTPLPWVFAIIGFLVYSNTLRSGFHFDDYYVIHNNVFIRDLRDLGSILNAFNTRFILGLTLALNHACGGLDAFGYHLFNVASHILASLSVYWLANLTLQTPVMKAARPSTLKNLMPLFSALLFLCHPIQTQVVNYIWQRGTSLAALFYITALSFYVHSRLRSSLPSFYAALLSTVMGMFTKEIAFTLPLTIVIYEWFFLKEEASGVQKTLRRTWPFLLCLLIIPVMLLRQPEVTTEIMRPHGTPMSMTRWVPEQVMPRHVYWITQLNVWRTYLRLLLFPAGQNLDYDYPVSSSLGEPRVLTSVALLAALAAAALLLYRRQRLLSFSLCWFFLALSLESFVVQMDVLFEHRLYLPMAAFSMFVCAGLAYALKDRRRFLAVMVPVVLAGSFLTYRRNEVWRDELSLWSDVVRKSPHKARGYANLATLFEKEGDHQKSIDYSLKAIALDPLTVKAYYNLGVSYRSLGDSAQAIEAWQKTIARDPQFKDAYLNLANLYGETGEPEKALQTCEQAIGIDPNHTEAYVTMAITYLELGRPEDSVAAARKAIRLSEKLAEAHNVLGVALAAQGKVVEANQAFRKALELDPDFTEAADNLRESLGEAGGA